MATRKVHTVQFKAKVALDAIREQKTINALTTEYGIHATQISTWKKQALSAITDALFELTYAFKNTVIMLFQFLNFKEKTFCR